MKQPKTICVNCEHFIEKDSLCGASKREQRFNFVTGVKEPPYAFHFAREINDDGDCKLYKKGAAK